MQTLQKYARPLMASLFCALLTLTFVSGCGGGGSDNGGSSNATLPFTTTLTWEANNDIDMHIFAPNDEHAYYSNKSIGSGELDTDEFGFGPETFTTSGRVSGVYRVAVNYYRTRSTEPATSPCTLVVRAGNTTRTFRFTLTEPNTNGGYPVTRNTSSWNRPCDIRVDSNGRVSIVSPDTSVSLQRGLSRVSPLGKDAN